MKCSHKLFALTFSLVLANSAYAAPPPPPFFKAATPAAADPDNIAVVILTNGVGKYVAASTAPPPATLAGHLGAGEYGIIVTPASGPLGGVFYQGAGWDKGVGYMPVSVSALAKDADPQGKIGIKEENKNHLMLMTEKKTSDGKTIIESVKPLAKTGLELQMTGNSQNPVTVIKSGGPIATQLWNPKAL